MLKCTAWKQWYKHTTLFSLLGLLRIHLEDALRLLCTERQFSFYLHGNSTDRSVAARVRMELPF